MSHDDPFSQRPSKTELKNDARELKKLGERLVNLPEGKFIKLALPDDLRQAIAQARAMASAPARNRQVQIIGRLLQGVDCAEIELNLSRIDHLPQHSQHEVHDARAEDLRQKSEMLLSGSDEDLYLLFAQHPRDELQGLRQTVRKAKGLLQKGTPKEQVFQMIYDHLRKMT